MNRSKPAMSLIPANPRAEGIQRPALSALMAATTLATLLFALPRVVHADPATDSVLAELDQKVAILERKLELKDEEEQKKATENAVVTAGKDGFSLKSADAESVLKLKYFQHVDGRFYIEDS